MNGIVRSLLFVTAIGLLAVVLICASDDSEAEQVEVVFGDGIAVTYQDRSGGTPPYPQYIKARRSTSSTHPAMPISAGKWSVF